MGLSPLYEPIELLRDDGIRTYSARETATGKMVLLYVFAGAQPQITQELLGQIQTLKDRRIPELIDTGANEDVPFVVTQYTPPVVSLREWILTQMERHGVPLPAGSLDHLTRVGRWKVPVAPPTPPTPAPSPQQPAGPGEFTRMFQVDAPPAPMGEPAPPPVAAPRTAPTLPEFSPQPQPGPGEFTRMFQLGASPAPMGEPVPPPVAAFPATPVAHEPPPPEPSRASQQQAGPGEFTRMFHSGASPAPMGEPMLPSVPAPTAMPVAPAASPQAPTFLPPKQGGPGEFTRYFSSPLPSSSPAYGSAPQPQIPPPAPTPRAVPAPPPTSFAPPGELTRIFGRNELGAGPLAAPIPPALPVQFGVNPPVPSAGSVASNSLPTPQYAPPSAPQPTGAPGEYTRMFGPQSRPSAPVQSPVPAPLAAPVSAAGQGRKKSVLPIILVLTGLFLVALLVVLLFALKK